MIEDVIPGSGSARDLTPALSPQPLFRRRFLRIGDGLKNGETQ